MHQDAPGAIYNVLKPVGMTSHDVVDFIRRLAGERRVGHAGTLDPAAAGVLLVMTGRYTRLSPYLASYDKTYRVEVTFGIATETGDADGNVIERKDASSVSPDRLRAVLSELTGLLLIKPHRFSAVKVEGKKAYEIAREGDEPELRERPAVIHRAELLSFHRAENPTALLELCVGKGTYVRSLAELLGALLDTCAHASFVLRTQAGPLSIEDAWTLEELEEAAKCGRLSSAAVSPSTALSGYPQALVTAD
ncbi:MAG: tRNA pseudouridine(55) synthase TruB, partial [Armatimonadetes bacterium]|nr:tRNA pseudouridine(55) synthase TruB [Armatimonadota bacterium]